MESSSPLYSEAAERPDLIESINFRQQPSSQDGNAVSTASSVGHIATTTQDMTRFVATPTESERSLEKHDPRMVMMAASPQPEPMHYRRAQFQRFQGFQCTCKPISLRHLPVSRRSNINKHRDGCPVSFLDRRSRGVAAGKSVLETLFSCFASIARYRIEYNFTARAIVLKSSPAFVLIDTLSKNRFQRIKNEKQLESRLLPILTDLKELFRQQEAWPTDTLSNDMNILHVSQYGRLS